MISHRAFVLEPWAVRETELDLDVLAQTESVFTLANGHIGLRGNLDEGEPSGLPGTYLNSFYEVRPMAQAEGGYGYPEAGQSIVNVTNGKIIRLLVEDEPFDVRYGQLLSHERVLDLRSGVLLREADWRSPAGARVQVKSTRLVSLIQRAIAAICYEVTAPDAPVRVVVQSELVANEPLPMVVGDPRAGSAVEDRLQLQRSAARDLGGLLVHSTAKSGLLMAAAMDHIVDGPADLESTSEAYEDEARVMVATNLAPGERLRVIKLIAYGWSSVRSQPAVTDQVRAALLEAKQTGWDGLLAEQRSFLDEFWDRGDVEIHGDGELQSALRASMFHCLQAASRAEERGIPAKGLTGTGYDGHTFWDMESFVLQLLTYTAPHVARNALAWRHAILDLAKERATELGMKGAAFPWRTIRGQECSGYWPASTAAFHINADIADAVIRYQSAVEDPEFEAAVGAELLVETARLWRSLGHHDTAGRFRIDGVTGPDEYSAVADNNVYTNLMAQQNLRAAADIAERRPDIARELGVEDEEAASWRDAANAMFVPYDPGLELHSQAETFTQHQRWDFAATPAEHYPLLLHYPYFDLYRKQVVKQADLVLAMHLRGDAFTDAQKARNFTYYEGLTVRDSSLSACIQAVIAAEVGHLQLAYDYFGEASLIDLDDLEHNTRDGLHLAALAGAWIAAVAGFGGMRDHDGSLSFKPRLPQEITRISFGVLYRGRALRVRADHRNAIYTLSSGDPLPISHHGQDVTVETGKPQTLEIPRLPHPGPAPKQPPNRAPERRHRPR